MNQTHSTGQAVRPGAANGGTATTERKDRAHAALPRETTREFRAPGCASWPPLAASRSWKKVRWANPAPAERGILALKPRTRRTKMTKIKTRLRQMAVAAILAMGLLLVAQIDSADATFSGKNGVIAFESNRTTGKDVHNPTGDTEIFIARPDGSGLEQLTHIKAEDVARVLPQRPPDSLRERTRRRFRALQHGGRRFPREERHAEAVEPRPEPLLAREITHDARGVAGQPIRRKRCDGRAGRNCPPGTRRRQQGGHLEGRHPHGGTTACSLAPPKRKEAENDADDMRRSWLRANGTEGTTITRNSRKGMP